MIARIKKRPSGPSNAVIARGRKRGKTPNALVAEENSLDSLFTEVRVFKLAVWLKCKTWDSPDPRQGPEFPFPGKEGFGVQKPHFPSFWKREFSVKKSPFSSTRKHIENGDFGAENCLFRPWQGPRNPFRDFFWTLGRKA